MVKQLQKEKETSEVALQKADQTTKELAKTLKDLNADYKRKEDKSKSEIKALNNQNQDLSKRITTLNQQLQVEVNRLPVPPAPAKLATTTTTAPAKGSVTAPAKLNEAPSLPEQPSPHTTTFKDGANFAFELLGKGQDLADRQAKSRMDESKQNHEQFVKAAGLHIKGSPSPYQSMQHPFTPMPFQSPYVFANGYGGGYHPVQSAFGPHGQMLHTPGHFPSQYSQYSFTPMQHMTYSQAPSYMPPHQATNHTAGPQYHFGTPTHGQGLPPYPNQVNVVPKLPDSDDNQ
jgi:hypothetical protein